MERQMQRELERQQQAELDKGKSEDVERQVIGQADYASWHPNSMNQRSARPLNAAPFETPGTDGAFKRALEGRGAWQVGGDRPVFGHDRLPTSEPTTDASNRAPRPCSSLPAARTASRTISPPLLGRRAGALNTLPCEEQAVPTKAEPSRKSSSNAHAETEAESYLRYLEGEIATQRRFLQLHRGIAQKSQSARTRHSSSNRCEIGEGNRREIGNPRSNEDRPKVQTSRTVTTECWEGELQNVTDMVGASCHKRDPGYQFGGTCYGTIDRARSRECETYTYTPHQATCHGTIDRARSQEWEPQTYTPRQASCHGAIDRVRFQEWEPATYTPRQERLPDCRVADNCIVNPVSFRPGSLSGHWEPVSVQSHKPSFGPDQVDRVAQGLAEVAEFSKRVPGPSSSQLRDVKVCEDDGSCHQISKVRSDGECVDKEAWHTIVSPVSNKVRMSLEELISQQGWAVPGRPVAYRYLLGRTVQNATPEARHRFDELLARDAAREGFLPPSLFASQRAFFCDDGNKLSQVIASPFGFGAAFSGMALLFALDLRYAEGLMSSHSFSSSRREAHPAKLKGRTLVAELALGRCHTAHYSLQDALSGAAAGCGGGRPMVPALEAEYRAGADSVYFPQSGIIALLCPSRALPLYLSEYCRQRCSPAGLES